MAWYAAGMVSSDGIGSGPLLQLLTVRAGGDANEPLRMTVHDGSFVFEVVFADGLVRGVTRVGSDGSFVGGERALQLLAQLRSGRFVIEDPSLPVAFGEDPDTDTTILAAPVVVERRASGPELLDDRACESAVTLDPLVGSPFVDGDESMSDPGGATAALRLGQAPSFGAMARRRVSGAPPAVATAPEAEEQGESTRPLSARRRRGGTFGYVALVISLAVAGGAVAHLIVRTRAQSSELPPVHVDLPTRSDVVKPVEIVLPEQERFPAADEPAFEAPARAHSKDEACEGAGCGGIRTPVRTGRPQHYPGEPRKSRDFAKKP